MVKSPDYVWDVSDLFISKLLRDFPAVLRLNAALICLVFMLSVLILLFLVSLCGTVQTEGCNILFFYVCSSQETTIKYKT